MDQSSTLSLDITSLTRAYQSGSIRPGDVLTEICARNARHADKALWIDLFPRKQMDDQLLAAQERLAHGIGQPLLGIPFAVKDNMDVAGHPTTAACPAFAYVAQETAPVIQLLRDAGAILVGKTNMDQFAAGLVGTRSPYGICRNLFDDRYIPGGSSTGSAIAVAAGLVSFSLGTDTAGSGRVPAAFNNIVGLKPSRGLLSCRGVVPACKSLDSVSIFALNCADARLLLSMTAKPDSGDGFSRRLDEISKPPAWSAGRFRFGAPDSKDLRFYGNEEWASLYQSAVERMGRLGGESVTIDYGPLARAAALLYEGPWIAERAMVVRELLERSPGALNKVTHSVISRGKNMQAGAVFEGLYKLAQCAQEFKPQWSKIDFLLLPTAGTIYTISDLEREPMQFNTNLGYYTNFVNLLDLCGVAVPSAMSQSGLPFGISLIAPAGSDEPLMDLAERYHLSSGLPMGATGLPLPSTSAPAVTEPVVDNILIAVVGAHLTGQPLNYQLTQRNATLTRSCKTAEKYRLYALAGTTPPKPGLARVEDAAGRAIEVEIWRMPIAEVGSFISLIAPPLGIGTLELEDGQYVKGFICENYAIATALDITDFGGWRAYLKSKQQPPA
ncbi:MAG: allophanate hydrolase [Planctomycetota bacterium]|nr:allophanate hydrolase [Planctomycetota bacterium]